MSDEAKQALKSVGSGDDAGCIAFVQQIVVAYAGSAGAQQAYIPALYANLVKLFTSGEVPR